MSLNTNFIAKEDCWVISYGVGNANMVAVEAGQQYTTGQPIVEWYKTKESAISRIDVLNPSWRLINEPQVIDDQVL